MLVEGKMKVVVESFETRSDHEFVEYFRQVPGNKLLYTFRVVKPAPAFSINIFTRALKNHQLMYNISLDGCQFLKNPLFKKVLGEVYRSMLVNESFTCPMKPKIYFIRSLVVTLKLPSFHPAGQFQYKMRVKMPQSKAPFVMEINAKYKVVILRT
ncbi:GH16566 [Drosophila grimshawi]|uniref:GH16566 n=2 Tax=Drosophila grimshawi TaxID=7222 RepID=B4J1N8_DROGR|nr:GH16566 [Drosophila grimshawi]